MTDEREAELERERLKRKKIGEIRLVGAGAVLSQIFAERPVPTVFRNEGAKKVTLGFDCDGSGKILSVVLHTAWTEKWMATLPNLLDAIAGHVGTDRAKALADSLGLRAEVLDFLTVRDGVLVRSDRRIVQVAVREGVTEIGVGAFHACKSLERVFIPRTVEKIGATAFNGCASLSSLFVDERSEHFSSVGGILYTKDVSVLIRCPQKMSGEIGIPETVRRIERDAFCECQAIRSLEIPAGLETLCESAFCLCASLSEVRFNGSLAQWDAVKKGRLASFLRRSLTVVCTDGSVEVRPRW